MNILIKKLAAAVAAQLSLPIPIKIDLLDVATITRLLKRNESQVCNRIVCLPDFPKAICLRVTGGLRCRCAGVGRQVPRQGLVSAGFFIGLSVLGELAARATVLVAKVEAFVLHLVPLPYPAVGSFGSWLCSR